MLREKKPCTACGEDNTADLRDCIECGDSLCRYCARDHACGEDGRPELVQLLGEHVTHHEGASALTMAEIDGALIVYLPRQRVISRSGLQALIDKERHRSDRVEVLAKNISESLCRAPLGARGAVCFASSDGFCSFFAAKKADTPEVLAQFRAMMEAKRLISF